MNCGFIGLNWHLVGVFIDLGAILFVAKIIYKIHKLRIEASKTMSNTSDLVHVVNRTALIENILNQIIEAFCEPRKDRFTFFWSVVLDTSIMSTGSKVKVASAIANELNTKIENDALHKVLSMRNAFAHNQTDSHPVLVVVKTPEDDEMHFQLHILSNSGKLSSKRRDEALIEFDLAYNLAKSSLINLFEVIKSQTTA